jgi:hypothetical protein
MILDASSEFSVMNTIPQFLFGPPEGPRSIVLVRIAVGLIFLGIPAL